MKHSHVLDQLRPPTPELDPKWSAQTLSAITSQSAARPTQVELDHMRSNSSRRRPRRAVRVVLLAAAAASVTVVAIPAFDSGDALAADLRDLSRAAVTYDGPVLEPGTWVHERSESLQRIDAALSDGTVLDTQRETWTRWDGQVLLIERRPSQGWTTYNVLDDQSPASFQNPTPAFAQTLPKDPEGLRAYLDPKVFGSTSHSEALFEALTGLAASHTLPPATLAAAYEAIADLDNVRTADIEVDGRPAIEITYEEQSTSSTNSITADRATGQVLLASQQSLQSTYTSTTTLSEIVGTVPAAVLKAFQEHDEGIRYDITGQPIGD